MEAENQQKILGYFIEEAKEHLETLEKGLVDSLLWPAIQTG